MTPEERQMLTSLADRVRSTQVPEKDGEAESLIRDMSASKPDAAYILTQTVLVQDLALRQAKAQIDAMQQQLVAQQQKPKSFLGGLFGGGTNNSVPQAGPWGQPQNQGYPGQQGYPPNQGYPGQGYPGQGYPQQGYPPQGGSSFGSGGFGQQPAAGGFLRGAAQTAVGVAGGALLFQGIESMFSGGHSGFGGGFGGGGLGGESETVVNNYYDNSSQGYDPGNTYDPGQDSGFDPGFGGGGGGGGGFDDDDGGGFF